MALNPPGMAVLENPPTLAYSRLCLEADFGWTGRPRLLAAGSQMAGQLLLVRIRSYTALQVSQIVWWTRCLGRLGSWQ